MKKKQKLGKDLFQTKPLVIPELRISESEKKPFTMWFLINSKRAEFRLNWRFWGIK